MSNFKQEIDKILIEEVDALGQWNPSLPEKLQAFFESRMRVEYLKGALSVLDRMVVKAHNSKGFEFRRSYKSVRKEQHDHQKMLTESLEEELKRGELK